MKQRGFSLVEALIVMAIISTCAAVLMPVTSSVRQMARTEIKVHQLRQLATATLIYTNEHDSQLPPADLREGVEWHRIALNGASRQEAASLLNPDKPDDSSVFTGLQSLGYSLNQCLSLGPYSRNQPSIEFNPYLIVQAAELKHKGANRVFTLTFQLPCHDRVYGELQGMEPSNGRYLADSDQGGSVAVRYDGSIKWAPFEMFRSKGCACSYPGSEPETPFQTFPR